MRQRRNRLAASADEDKMRIGDDDSLLYYTPMAEAAKPGVEPEDQTATASPEAPEVQLQALPPSRRWQVPILGNAAYAFVRLTGPTLRYDICGLQNIERVHASGRQCIFAFWHRGLIPLSWWARGRKIAILSGTNFDAQWAAYVTLGFGLRRVLGSSSRGGLKGIIALGRSMAEGYDAAFTADGPRGPRYVAKPGPVLLARRAGGSIVCVHAFCESAHTFEKAWDLFQVPYPFSRVALIFAPPIDVPADADIDAIAAKHAEMQGMLERVRDAAESWFQVTSGERERQRAFWNS